MVTTSATSSSVLVPLSAVVRSLAVRLLGLLASRVGRRSLSSVALWTSLLVTVVMMALLLLQWWCVRSSDFTKSLWNTGGVLVLMGKQMLVLVANRHAWRCSKTWNRSFHTVWNAATRWVLSTWVVLRILRVLVVSVSLVVVGVAVWVVWQRHTWWWRWSVVWVVPLWTTLHLLHLLRSWLLLVALLLRLLLWRLRLLLLLLLLLLSVELLLLLLLLSLLLHLQLVLLSLRGRLWSMRWGVDSSGRSSSNVPSSGILGRVGACLMLNLRATTRWGSSSTSSDNIHRVLTVRLVQSRVR